MNKDYCLRGTAKSEKVRFFIASTKELVEQARIKHNLSPLAAAALGRTMTATAMMGINLKGKDTITIVFKGDGVLGNVIAKGNSDGEVKGYVDNPEADLPLKNNGKIDVSAGIGFGNLYITKDMGLKDPYVGTVPIVSGEIGEDITEYFYSSEQTLSAVGLGVLIDIDYSVKSAGGFILQLMPGAEMEIGAELDDKVQNLPPLSTYLIDNTPEDLLEYFFGYDYKLLDKKNVKFHCQCNKDNFKSALITLGKVELEKLAKDDEIEVVCQFCNEKYIFDNDELLELVKLI
ncbi:MAG: Hsp33 family molecular chaperone HslO [Firmicutes bacterium]|nr:Hsp33 family molecular chaperone HslO [Bacillota bacterium]